ncbi:MAG TPA: hypothetical protein PKH02_09665 [Bacteroidales bacterium]|nr:hypothetical protein [Bacteroidales bacterium]
MIDIRFPIGLMFTILGVIVTVYGLGTMGNAEMYAKSLHLNMNLISGLVMLVFGLGMLLWSDIVRNWLKKKKA